jgi:hypothetical protein
MAFSQATIVSRARHILNDNPFVETARTVAAAGTTSVTVADSTLYDVGDILEWQDDGDQMLVTAVPNATTLTVARGINGTTAAAHSSITLAKNPVFQYIQITDAIAACMTDLYPHVYRQVDVTLTPLTNGNNYYELTSASGADKIIELSQVSQEIGTGATSMIFFYGDRPGAYPVTLQRNVPTSKVASGVGLYIPFLRDTSNSIIVAGIAEIDDTVSGGNYSYITSGVEVNTVLYYAIGRLVSEADISRLTQDDTNMYDQSVKPFARTQGGMYWENKGLQERRKWEARLRARTPRLKKWNR